MKKYVSHKVVEAAKILSVDHVDDANPHYELVLEGEEVSVLVPENFYARGGPHIADLGWLVVYGDGYKSWTPSKPFEDGYTLMDEDQGED